MARGSGFGALGKNFIIVRNAQHRIFGLRFGYLIRATTSFFCALTPVPRCAVPECRGISHADATFREALWDRFFTAAPRPRTPSELLYSDRRLRSKSSPAATILIRKR